MTFAALPLWIACLMPAAEPFELRQGDRVCIIGNGMADRMQHDGWFDTLLHARFPNHDLIVRNLGFAGDEIDVRMRSQDFGTPDQWLAKCQADVIIAFFGYNESRAGGAGLVKFKSSLDAWAKRTVDQKYNGKSAPRIVLVSPIAHQNLNDPNLPDAAASNEFLANYTLVMADIAKRNGIAFVDVFTPTHQLYSRSAAPITINGIHLNAQGNRIVSDLILTTLFGAALQPDGALAAEIRKAVLDKNFHWYQRYRTTDGYSIFGGRADLKFVDGQTNRVVAQREMEILDVMTANRDPKIWAAARGQEFTVDDSNTPPFIPVVTNKPGPLSGGKHIFLGGEEAIGKMRVHRDMKVSLFASEETFPELVNPVQMAWDTKGRLWVATWNMYPHWKPKTPFTDKLLILEDTNGDGKADKCTTFAGDLQNPTGFEFYNGGVIVAACPDLLFLKDINGDDKVDTRERILHGLDTADTHHSANSFAWDHGGGLYFQEGTFHQTQMETPWGPVVRNSNAGVYRFEPRTYKTETYISYPFANPHGHAFDEWGQDIVVDGTGANPFHAALFSGHIEHPNKHARPPQVYQQRTRPCPGIEYLSSRHFPDEMQGNLLVPNVIGDQGILRYKIEDDGSSFKGTELEPIVLSTDANFRPSDLKIGPDGAIYFIDWHNPIIGHMQHNLRDPSRDVEHGRVYKVTYNGRPLVKPPVIAGAAPLDLFQLLQEPELRTRARVRTEIAARPTREAIATAIACLLNLDPKRRGHAQWVLEMLWVHQAHNVVDINVLDAVLALPEYRARAAAARVLCLWRDRVPNAIERFRKLAADESPRVRLEAVRAASFFTQPEAVEIALIAAEHSTDKYLEYTIGETMKTLEPIVKRAVAAGVNIPFATEVGAKYLLKTVPLDRLAKLPRSRAVCLELLYRAGVSDEVRRSALTDLAKMEGRSEAQVLLEVVRLVDEKKESRDEAIVFDLVRLLVGRSANEMAAVRGELEKLALAAKQPVIREVGFVALMTVDNSTDKAWALATKSPAALKDFLAAVPLLADVGLRGTLYSKIAPLLDALPPEMASASKAKQVEGRYVRIELPGKQRTLTLAEVEVFSDGRNVARSGKASQANTSNRGVAARAIDGNRSGAYGDGGQTHSQEGTQNPWWEVDLGAVFPIDSIVLYNRTEGNFGNRLAGYTIKVLDDKRKPTFERKQQPPPAPRSEFALADEAPQRQIARAAMSALVSIGGREAETFAALAKFVSQNRERASAIRALRALPVATWPKENAAPLLEALMTSIRKTPTSERTSPVALDSLELSEALAGLLPPDRAKAVRKELGELGVRVIRIGTLPERMAYDKETIVVQAGKPVEFVFENFDFMPHNLTILEPGSLEEVGNLAESTATQFDAAARHFVPPSKKILLASTLLQPRDVQKLSYRAPTKAGVYPYVCTYPGHWRRMYGALVVVDDLESYLSSPDGYLAAHQLPIADALLKDRRTRTEWKFEDLSDQLAGLKTGRSYDVGKQAFKTANCTSCHKLEGAGNEFGPDMAKFDEKMTLPEILKHVLDPSLKIDDKYRTYAFALSSGKLVTGLILEETDAAVKVIENPLASANPTVIKKGEIEGRRKSDISLMPKGLLDKLTRDEVLDLIAYVAAKGNKNSPLFIGGQGHH